MSADTADKILSSDWLVSLKLCSDWLDEPFKRRISKVAQTDKQTNWSDKLLNCLLSQLKTWSKMALLQFKSLISPLKYKILNLIFRYINRIIQILNDADAWHLHIITHFLDKFSILAKNICFLYSSKEGGSQYIGQ